MVETLEDQDDVQHVYANFDIDEKEIQAAVCGLAFVSVPQGDERYSSPRRPYHKKDYPMWDRT